jgi:hypothetical protein
MDDPLLPLFAGLTPDTRRTSRDAAERIADTRETQRRLVLEAIRAAGSEGRTDDELQMVLSLDGSSERPRRWELWKLNRITVKCDDAGDAVTRLTRTQRRAVVWVATDARAS